MSDSFQEPRFPLETCPYCAAKCEADFVDVGVGFAQCGPFHCEQCGSSEIGGNDDPRELTESERQTGWYAPGAEPGSSANVIGGKVVSHQIMQATYAEAFAGSPMWHDKKYVEDWFAALRAKTDAAATDLQPGAVSSSDGALT